MLFKETPEIVKIAVGETEFFVVGKTEDEVAEQIEALFGGASMVGQVAKSAPKKRKRRTKAELAAAVEPKPDVIGEEAVWPSE